jgi:hypothetical protein
VDLVISDDGPSPGLVDANARLVVAGFHATVDIVVFDDGVSRAPHRVSGDTHTGAVKIVNGVVADSCRVRAGRAPVFNRNAGPSIGNRIPGEHVVGAAAHSDSGTPVLMTDVLHRATGNRAVIAPPLDVHPSIIRASTLNVVNSHVAPCIDIHGVRSSPNFHRVYIGIGVVRRPDIDR